MGCMVVLVAVVVRHDPEDQRTCPTVYQELVDRTKVPQDHNP